MAFILAMRSRKKMKHLRLLLRSKKISRRTSFERYRVDSDRIDGAHHLMGVWGIVKSHKTWKNGLSVHLPCFAAMNCWGAKGITTT